jgi:hydrogenase expression/formation protein HypC
MCIGFPGRVVELDAYGAVVETEGRRRRATTLYLPDIAVGDWVTVVAGAVVDRLEPERAAEIETLLRTAIRRHAGHSSSTTTQEGVPDVEAV